MAAARPLTRVTEGAPEPLGARLVAEGLNVAVWSAHATAVEVCLFDEDGQAEIERITLPGRTGPVFHGCVAGLGVGARYGLRVHGPFDPASGHRFNPAKLLVDPYALALDRPFTLHPLMFGYDPANPEEGSSFDATDSAPHVPKAIVTPPPEATPLPEANVPWARTVVYELHVRGFTRLHPDIPSDLRGTFAGLAHPAAIAHFKRLGVTTVELLPSAAWIDERHLPPLGLTNYWGYNPLAFLAPDPRLAPGGWADVRAATEALAAAGIETVLDVVFNHTGESDALGPTVSLRGLDNASYYRLDSADPARYVNDAGTGDILALDRPAPLRLAMDAMRAWRRYGGVAGFRFDLATVLARRADGFDPAAPLLAAIDQDPELRDLKRIAEPWDCGPGGYQLGAFPATWGEWNDRFRDDLRGFWRGDTVSLGELARRLAGSEDLFAGRPPSRGVNFVVAHDGMSLADLVSYAGKHNEANGEHNRDGTGDNRSWNNGVEGASDDPAVLAARRRDQKALLALLLLARGTPMLTMGAELGHSQGGNNNAYAQDNAISWLDWGAADQALIDFTARLIVLRQAHPALRADRYLDGQPVVGEALPDVDWRRADGAGLIPDDWDDPKGETLVMALAEPDAGRLDRVIVIVHRGREPAEVVLPEPRDGFAWRVEINSADDDHQASLADEDRLTVSARSVMALAETPTPKRQPRGVEDLVQARLAQAADVSLDWWGVDGDRHLVSPDSLRAVLAAMGIAAATSQQARAALVRLADAFDRRAVPFKQVAHASDTATIVLPFEARAAPPRTWLNIEDERGETRRIRIGDGAGSVTSIPCRDGRATPAIELDLPALPLGRYRLWREDRPDVVGALTIAPHACYRPETFKMGGRAFAVSSQIYSVRREGDQGTGDFTTLGELGATAAREGAAMLCINPMHALLDTERDQSSPYYPSDRRFLDPIYLDLTEVPFAADFAGPAAELSRLALIDYPAVWALKSAALEASFAKAKSDPALDAFIAQGGELLAQFAAFQAIAEARPGEAWSTWPADLRSADGPGVPAFAARHADRVRFHQYLQWLCEAQMARAAERAAGLSLGFCRDLAVGAAPGGAEAWGNARLIAHGVSIGAPPDPIGPQGQVWGLPPFDPHKLRADGWRAMAELFATNMRHAGALRIDHVMGLARQFWVPAGAEGADGAYVAFPLDDLLGELALESVRAKRLVVGEDLGTVPAGLREKLAAAAVLSYRVAPFERDGQGFKRPSAYPPLAMACVSTHDLPPLAGWWEGVDIEEREALALYTAEQAEQAHAERRADRQALIQALRDEGLVSQEVDPDHDLDQDLVAAIHAFIAATPCHLATAQVDDLVGERIAVNLPGTHVERPNWRRRLAAPLEGLMDGPLAQAILDALRARRTAS